MAPVPGNANGLIVYIVDDDAAVRASLARLMRSADIEVRLFDGAEAFLAEAGEARSGCMLLDITLPRMNGLRLCARLRELGVDLPVIALSARDDDETLRLARELGVRLFLHKPVDGQALLDAIGWVTGAGAGPSNQT
jgi:FixJ family two-component response regulator